MEIQQAESSFNCNKDGKKGIFVIYIYILKEKRYILNFN